MAERGNGGDSSGGGAAGTIGRADESPAAALTSGDAGGSSGPGGEGGLRFVAAACALRLVVLPALCFPMTLVAMGTGALPRSASLLMILSVSSGTPSSQTLVALLTARGASELAATASKVYVPQYVLSVLSVSAIIGVVIAVHGEDDGWDGVGE